jgi:hypothetical protein
MTDVSNDFLDYGASFIVTKTDYDIYYRDSTNLLGQGGERFQTPNNQMAVVLRR